MATPHINAEMGDFADVVLMPGDPLRAKHIAETFLEDVREVNNVRGMLGFTGTYKGRKISVMGHGMGIPSCSIYTKELITDFGVKKIIRVGSCGAVREDVKLRDVVIGMGACTDSKVNRLRFKDHDFAAFIGAGEAQHAAHVVHFTHVFEKGFCNVLGAQRVARHQDYVSEIAHFCVNVRSCHLQFLLHCCFCRAATPDPADKTVGPDR